MRRFWMAWVIVLTTLAPIVAKAHEIVPVVGDVTQTEGRVTLTLDGTFEAMIADLDLDGLANTNDSAQSATYDRLRALPDGEFAAQLQGFSPQLMQVLGLTADGADLNAQISDIEVIATPDLELPRRSIITVQADWPSGAQVLGLDWPRSYGALVLRKHSDSTPWDTFISGGGSAQVPLAAVSQSAWDAFMSYIPVGIDHIVPLGLDHILFVLGLYFYAARWGALLWQVSAFTVAHTIALALASLQIVVVPGSIVEPLIAASIVFVALENIWSRGNSPWRIAVIFAFGLLHGLGFASVLQEFGLAEGRFIPSLLGFNLGVELGQLLVIAVAALVTVWALRVDHAAAKPRRTATLGYGLAALAGGGYLAWAWTSAGATQQQFAAALLAGILLCLGAVRPAVTHGLYAPRVAVPASLAIAAIGLYWVIERVFL